MNLIVHLQQLLHLYQAQMSLESQILSFKIQASNFQNTNV